MWANVKLGTTSTVIEHIFYWSVLIEATRKKTHIVIFNSRDDIEGCMELDKITQSTG